MPVTDVKHDMDTLSVTIVADFAAPVERIWEVYADAAARTRLGASDLPRHLRRPQPDAGVAVDVLHDESRG